MRQEFLKKLSKPKFNHFSKNGYIFLLFVAILGFGDLIKFPYLVAKYGIAIFLIFIVGLIIVGLPFFILEIIVAKKLHLSGIKIIKTLNPKNEILGWIQVAICVAIGLYYVIILGWGVVFFCQLWIPNFLKDIYIHTTNSSEYININSKYLIAAALVVIWILVVFAFTIDIKKYITKFSALILPIAFVAIFALLIYLLVQKDSLIGLNNLFHWNFRTLGDIQAWSSGLGQVFFTMAIGTGIVFSCSKYSNNTQEVNNLTAIVIVVNIFFALICSMLIYCMLGNQYAHSGSTLPFEQWLKNNFNSPANFNYTFNTFSYIFAIAQIKIGYGANLLGALFFASILLLGFGPLLVIIFSIKDNLQEKSKLLLKKKYIIGFALFWFLICAVWTYAFASDIINLLDDWVTNNMLIIFVIIECFLLLRTKFYGQDEEIFEYSNKRSAYTLPAKNLSFIILYVLPVLLFCIWGYQIGFLVSQYFINHDASYSQQVIVLAISVGITIFMFFSIFLGLFLKRKIFIYKRIVIQVLIFLIPIVCLIFCTLYILVSNYEQLGNIKFYEVLFNFFVLTFLFGIFPIIMTNLDGDTLSFKQLHLYV